MTAQPSNIRIWLILYSLIIGIAISCDSIFPDIPADNEVLDGPLEGLTPAQRTVFIQGDADFNNQIFSPTNGLGPIFVATSCGSCHPGDGKGHPFTTLTRFGQTDATGNQFLSMGGPQLQQHAIPGYEPEQIPSGATFSKFIPPANTGLGYLEAVSDADLLLMADPADGNGDGISGEVNWIELPSFITPSQWNVSSNAKFIGRFGKKASAFNLLHQTVNAYIQDMGITSPYHPTEISTVTDNVPDPEIPQTTVDNVVQYIRTLKAPLPRRQNDQEVMAGNSLFVQIGCENCHKETLTTAYSPIQPLSYVTFHPYTDLLLHDMGPGLDDSYTEGTAITSEWRTPPLWGLGLSKKSQGGKYFLLHDGRATGIDEAILLHGGEAQRSNDLYKSLSGEEKQKLIAFLESL